MGNKKYILAIGMLACSSGLIADNNDSATATVSGEVIRSLQLIKQDDLTLPDLVLPDSGETTSVNLACSGSPVVSYGSNGGNPFVNGDVDETAIDNHSKNKLVGEHEGTCAIIDVGGEPSYHYSVSPITTSQLATGITLTSINCHSTNSTPFVLAAGFGGMGTDRIRCGGAIEITENASVSSYSSTDALSITVVYD
jgi:hypothetical protein